MTLSRPTRGNKYASIIKSIKSHVVKFKPRNISKAFANENWKQSIMEVFESVKDQNEFHAERIKCYCIDEDENIVHNKTRLVAQGYPQIQGVDYFDTYANVVRKPTVRIFIALWCQYKVSHHVC